jgi:hypothetical protein
MTAGINRLFWYVTNIVSWENSTALAHSRIRRRQPLTIQFQKISWGLNGGNKVGNKEESVKDKGLVRGKGEL